VRNGELLNQEETDADLWFSAWDRGGVLVEEARYLERWDQTLTLLWFENEEVPTVKQRPGLDAYDDDGDRETADDEEGPRELDGVLRFRSKKRRR
jgi:hypothetical protein